MLNQQKILTSLTVRLISVMPCRYLASKESLAKVVIVSCLLLTLFACNQANNADAQTSVTTQTASMKEQDVTSTSSVSANVSSKLTLDLAVDQEYLRSGKLSLIATLKNRSANEVSFLPWANPFEKNVTADFLTIVDLKTGVELSYRGIMVKRMPPKPSDYQTLAPQESIRNTIDISASYHFCAYQQLKIVFSGALYNQLSNPYNLELNSLELVLPDTFPDC
jgi:hypothetical protein